MTTPSAEAARRRTFAIISHPDAGKTTLTEKFLLYGGALAKEAGAVKAKGGRRSATSDWMAMEQQRGISITSTVMQFPYRDCVINLLDTPGHRDFSEDTYRVLAAADAAGEIGPVFFGSALTNFGVRKLLDDVVGLVNATDVRVGDSLYLDEPVSYPGIPSFAPEHFSVARVRDTGRFKQFRRGIAQLDEEGVVQVLRDADLGDQAPLLAAVGPMQFEVAVHRLENEFGAPVELNPTSYRVARRTDEASEPTLKAMQGVDVLQRADGTRYALFESRYWLERVEREQPELTLDRLVAEGGA